MKSQRMKPSVSASEAEEVLPPLPEAPPLPALPLGAPQDGLRHYLQQIKTFPVLTAEEEYMLAKRWTEHNDLAAAHRMTTSHLRLVAKIAHGYRGYGLPLPDLIAEGNIGLMQAVKRFDPEKGFRLATYAMWWIKASIQEFILRSWSVVKVGSSATQKRLFFNLRKLKRHLGIEHERSLTPEQTAAIAERLSVSAQDVTDMDERLSAHDHYLSDKIGGEDSDTEWGDQLADTAESHEVLLAESQEVALKRRVMHEAMEGLNEREREILTARRLQEPPATLEELSQRHNVSRERVRQIEVRAMEKLEQAVQALLPRMLERKALPAT